MDRICISVLSCSSSELSLRTTLVDGPIVGRSVRFRSDTVVLDVLGRAMACLLQFGGGARIYFGDAGSL